MNPNQKYVIKFRNERNDDAYLAFFEVRKHEMNPWRSGITVVDFDLTLHPNNALRFSRKKLARYVTETLLDIISNNITVLITDLKTDKEILIGVGKLSKEAKE